MNFTPALIGLAAYILIWEKLPTWGTWFNAVVTRLPRPLQTLYEQWRCPFCVGFWMGLVIHAATGFWSLPTLAQLPAYWGVFALPLGWTLDALATGTLMLIGKIALDAIGLPAMKSHLMRDEFMKSFVSTPADKSAT